VKIPNPPKTPLVKSGRLYLLGYFQWPRAWIKKEVKPPVQADKVVFIPALPIIETKFGDPPWVEKELPQLKPKNPNLFFQKLFFWRNYFKINHNIRVPKLNKPLSAGSNSDWSTFLTNLPFLGFKTRVAAKAFIIRLFKNSKKEKKENIQHILQPLYFY